MLNNILSASIESACKVCGGRTVSIGQKWIGYSCNDRFSGSSQFPSESGSIEYHRCQGCGFLFTKAMDHWSDADFRAKIYNDDYVRADPPFEFLRPTRNAEIVGSVLNELSLLSHIKALDYGSGCGRFVDLMKQRGLAIEGYDPFYDSRLVGEKTGYDLITAFEVVEHVRHGEQGRLFSEFERLLSADGVVLFSTRMFDEGWTDSMKLEWWYLAPRNGHVSIHGQASLACLAGQNGLQLKSFNEDVHLLFREGSVLAERMTCDRVAGKLAVMGEVFECA